jgi:single-stranded-DNA-specific exonuclease
MTLKEENYSILKKPLKTSAGNDSSDMLIPEIEIDAEIDFADTPKLTEY